MNTLINRRQALKTLTATGLGAALANFSSPAFAETAKATPFDSRRDLGNSLWLGPNLLSILAEAETTGSGAVIPPHRHTREDEIIFMLEGELEITLNDVVSIAKPGDHFFMPRGNVHTFKVISPTPVTTLVMFTPGGLEGAYKQVGRPAERLELPPAPPAPTPEQRARVAEIFAGYGYYILPPTN
jgi:Cupin domain